MQINDLDIKLGSNKEIQKLQNTKILTIENYLGYFANKIEQ